MDEWDRIARAGAAWQWGTRWSTAYAAIRYAKVIAAAAGALAVLVALAVGAWWLTQRVPVLVVLLAGAALLLCAGMARLAHVAVGRGRATSRMDAGGWLLLAGLAVATLALLAG